MTAADVDFAASLLEQGGWGRAADRAALFRVALELPTMEPIVAVERATLVGTALASAHGSAGWIGVVFVVGHARGRGIGSRLTAAAVHALERTGCTTLQLVATPEGRPIYERLGFEVETTYRLLSVPGDEPSGIGPDAQDDLGVPRVSADGSIVLRSLARSDLPEAVALDAEATDEDRSALIETTSGLGPGTAAVDADGRLRGWTMRAPWGGWPTIAEDVNAGLALLAHRRRTAARGRAVVAGLPAGNRVGIETLLATGWTDRGEVPRLVRGPRRAWHPTAIWGQFSFAMG